MKKIPAASFLCFVLSGCGPTAPEPEIESKPPVDLELILKQRNEETPPAVRVAAESPPPVVVGRTPARLLESPNKAVPPPESFVTKEMLQELRVEFSAVARSEAEGIFQAQAEGMFRAQREEILRAQREEVLKAARSEIGEAAVSEVSEMFEGRLTELRSEVMEAVTVTVSKELDEKWADLMKNKESEEAFITEEMLQELRAEFSAVARSEAEGIFQAQAEGMLRAQREEILQAQGEEILTAVRSEMGEAAVSEVSKAFEGRLTELRSDVVEAVTVTVSKALDEKWADLMKDKEPPESFATEEMLQELRAEILSVARSEAERIFQAQAEGILQAQREEILQAQREEILQAQREEILQAQREEILQAQREEILQAQREEVLTAVRSEMGEAAVSEVSKAFEVRLTELRSEVMEAVTATVSKELDEKWADLMKDKEPEKAFATEEMLQELRAEILSSARSEAESTAIRLANKIFEDKLKALQAMLKNQTTSPLPVAKRADRPEEGFETKNYTITLQDTPPATVTFTVLLGNFQQPLRNKGDCVKIKGRDFSSLEILITHTMPMFLATLCSFRNTGCFPGNYTINEAQKDGESGGLFFYSLRPSTSPLQSGNCPLLSI